MAVANKLNRWQHDVKNCVKADFRVPPSPARRARALRANARGVRGDPPVRGANLVRCTHPSNFGLAAITLIIDQRGTLQWNPRPIWRAGSRIVTGFNL